MEGTLARAQSSTGASSTVAALRWGLWLMQPGNRRMSRDQRVHDNWALIHACEQASKTGAPVAVAFNLARPPACLICCLSDSQYTALVPEAGP